MIDYYDNLVKKLHSKYQEIVGKDNINYIDFKGEIGWYINNVFQEFRESILYELAEVLLTDEFFNKILDNNFNGFDTSEPFQIIIIFFDYIGESKYNEECNLYCRNKKINKLLKCTDTNNL